MLKAKKKNHLQENTTKIYIEKTYLINLAYKYYLKLQSEDAFTEE